MYWSPPCQALAAADLPGEITDNHKKAHSRSCLIRRAAGLKLCYKTEESHSITQSLKWDSFSKCKYIPHNIQGSYLRERKKRTSKGHPLFRMVNESTWDTNAMT